MIALLKKISNIPVIGRILFLKLYDGFRILLCRLFNAEFIERYSTYSDRLGVSARLAYYRQVKKGGKAMIGGTEDGMSPAPVMLHSLFRSGSTYMFNQFRKEQRFWCYYEPLHHQVQLIRKNRMTIFFYDKTTTAKMNHPELERPHFYEYVNVVRNGPIPYFHRKLSYREFFCVQSHARLYKYVDALLTGALENTVPLLQFNRSSLRIGWFQHFFGGANHVFLLRHHRDQFESYFRRMHGEDLNMFLAINLYIIAQDPGRWLLGNAYTCVKDYCLVTGRLDFDLTYFLNLAPVLSPATHYNIFLHLWVCSLIHAVRYADLIIDMNLLSEDVDYRADIVRWFATRYDVSPSIFNDCSVKKYASYSVDSGQMSELEEEIRELYADDLAKVGLNIF